MVYNSEEPELLRATYKLHALCNGVEVCFYCGMAPTTACRGVNRKYVISAMHIAYTQQHADPAWSELLMHVALTHTRSRWSVSAQLEGDPCTHLPKLWRITGRQPLIKLVN